MAAVALGGGKARQRSAGLRWWGGVAACSATEEAAATGYPSGIQSLERRSGVGRVLSTILVQGAVRNKNRFRNMFRNINLQC